jgi:transposase-like protein
MAAQKKYPDELRERAVKMLFEVREREGRGRGELARVARQLGVHPEALRSWAKQAEIDGGSRPVLRPMISGGSRSWRRKTGNSAALMRSRRPPVPSTRRITTGGASSQP